MKTIDTPLDKIESVYAFFHDPANMPQLQVASDKTLYAWQHMSGFQYTQQVLRAGPIHELPERIDPAIGRISVEFSDGAVKTVDDYFDTSSMDALLVLRGGDIVFERYKTMQPFDKHNWFSCSKSIVGTSLALLEHDGKVDVSKPVSRYLPELAGSVWDTVTVEETLDMATGLDSTEHEVEDARTNPARGWYKWAVSIGLFEDTQHQNQSPIDVLRAMKRAKPGHTVFEYNSMNTYVCQLIVETVTHTPIAEFFGERIWRRIGAQNDGYLGMNKQGHANCWGFMNSTLRDLGRYGMIYTPSASRLSAEPIIPDAVMRKFQTGLRPEMYTKGAVGRPFQDAFAKVPGLANRYQWDVVCPDGDLFKAGVGGQGLFVSPSRDAVVAFFSTGDARDERLGAWLARTVTETFSAAPTQVTSDPLAQFESLPGALPTRPISHAKDGRDFTLGFLEDAHTYFDSFHMQLGGDHATYYCMHFSEFLPSTNAIPYGPVSELERAIDPALGKTTFKAVDGDPVLPLDEYVNNGKARVQGLIIAHRGKVVYEQFPGIQPNQPHLLFSVTKTTVGLMMAMLQAEGAVDVQKVVSDYVPAVKGSVWDTIKVINVLNMATGLKDIEEMFPRPGGDQKGTLLDPHSLMCRFFYATFGTPNAEGKRENWVDVVRSVQPDPTIPQGTKMQYSSMLTHMLAVIVENVAGRRFSQSFEDRVWSKIGARNPAEFAATPDGTTMAYGFLSLALEDLVRYGMIYTPSVRVISKESIVPKEAFDLIQNGGDPKTYKGTGDYERGFRYFGEETYKNSYQWDSLFEDGAMWKHGNLAQGLYVDPKRDVVGAYFSTNPLTGVWDRSGGYIRAAAKILAGG